MTPSHLTTACSRIGLAGLLISCGTSDLVGKDGGVGAVDGWVCMGPHQTASQGAQVGAPDSSGKPQIVETDANGYFELRNVPAGEVTIVMTNHVDQVVHRVTVAAQETTRLGTPCPTPAGSLRLHLCTDGPQTARAGATVVLTYLEVGGVQPDGLRATSDALGDVVLNDLPPGAYRVGVEGGETIGTAQVEPDTESTLDDPACRDPASVGSVSGRICDPADASPIEGLPVTLGGGPDADRFAVTDSDGRFHFDDVTPGSYVVTVRPPGKAPIQTPATIRGGQTTDLIASSCGPSDTPDGTAALSGTTCIGVTEAHMVAGVNVTAHTPSGDRNTTSGLDGRFSLSGLTPGQTTVDMRRGSWAGSFTVTLGADETLDVTTGHCIGGDARVAVVTGIYDNLLQPFQDLGLPVRRDRGALVDAGGTVDILDGSIATWTDEIAAADLAAYDAILFTSGLNLAPLVETDPCGLPPANTESCHDMPGVRALENIQSYLDAGGAVFVSDWGYEIVRRQFPQYINFYDNDFIRFRAMCGHAPATPQALIMDERLGALFGGSQVSISFEDNYELWTVVDSWSAQQNPNAVPIIVADVNVYEYLDATNPCDPSATRVVKDSPLLIATPVGTNGGRLFFSTFRYLDGTGIQNAEIIRQIILEL